MILSNKIIRSKVNYFETRMTTMKRGMMTLVLTCFLVASLGIFATQTKAEELKWKVISYITNAQQIPVPDEEGHSLGVFERRGSAIFEDGEMTALLGVGTTDRTKDGQGGGSYWQYTFKDGSTIWTKVQFTGRTPPGEKLPFIENKGEFIKGTGRFEGIKGSYTCKGPYITPVTPDKTKGDYIVECIGTRNLPPK
jgi:hypothetical protein